MIIERSGDVEMSKSSFRIPQSLPLCVETDELWSDVQFKYKY